MLCGCYEAVSACRPLVTSRKQVLMEYFTGAYFVDNNAESIAMGLQKVLNNSKLYAEKSKDMKNRLHSTWQETYIQLEKEISRLHKRSYAGSEYGESREIGGPA